MVLNVVTVGLKLSFNLPCSHSITARACVCVLQQLFCYKNNKFYRLTGGLHNKFLSPGTERIALLTYKNFEILYSFRFYNIGTLICR